MRLGGPLLLAGRHLAPVQQGTPVYFLIPRARPADRRGALRRNGEIGAADRLRTSPSSPTPHVIFPGRPLWPPAPPIFCTWRRSSLICLPCPAPPHPLVPPWCRFLEKVALHIAKNFLADAGAFDPSTKVPLILGIWGGKGQGKSFQTELCFKKLG